MRKADLELIGVVELRAMAEQNGLMLRRKVDIIDALAEDVTNQSEAIEAGTTIMGQAFSHMMKSFQPTREELKELLVEIMNERVEEGTGVEVRFSEVPFATCDINGSYITPPYWDEFEAAISISHVAFQGPYGSGKTTTIHKMAERMGKRLAVVNAEAGLRKRDLISSAEMKDATSYYQMAEFASAAFNGDWALIEELNFSDADATGFLLGMLDKPGIKGATFTLAGKSYPVSPEFRCIITRNINLAGTKKLNEALLDRFISFNVAPLLDDKLDQMLIAHKMPEQFRKQSVELVETLYRAWENNQIAYQISPRRVLQAFQLSSVMGISSVEKFREMVTTSVLNKIDDNMDKRAVSTRISSLWDTLDSLERSNRNV